MTHLNTIIDGTHGCTFVYQSANKINDKLEITKDRRGALTAMIGDDDDLNAFEVVLLVIQ